MPTTSSPEASSNVGKKPLKKAARERKRDKKPMHLFDVRFCFFLCRFFPVNIARQYSLAISFLCVSLESQIDLYLKNYNDRPLAVDPEKCSIKPKGYICYFHYGVGERDLEVVLFCVF